MEIALTLDKSKDTSPPRLQNIGCVIILQLYAHIKLY